MREGEGEGTKTGETGEKKRPLFFSPPVPPRFRPSSISSAKISLVSVEVRSRCRGKSLTCIRVESMTSFIVIT